MSHKFIQPIRTAGYITLSLLTASVFAFAQDQQDEPPPADVPQQQSPAPNHTWRRAADPPPQDQPSYRPAPNYSAYPNYSQRNQPDYSQRNQPDYPQRNQQPDPPNYQVPAQVTIKPGTFVTVRVNQPLSSDRNQAGDAFTATLVRPVVVDGVIVAQRGQTIGGRVAEAQKAGRVEGVARLGVQLTDLSLVDGQQVPIQSQLISHTAPTSVGRDAVGIGTTTAVGAAAGAAAGGGTGAGIGAGAGAVVGVIGVLLTRGHPSVIYPESVLTFRIEAPVTISTERAPQAFRYVDPNEYDRPYDTQQPPPQYAGAGYGYYPPAPYYYGYGYPYYWGPSLGFYWGPSFYYGRGFYGRGFYGGRFYGRGGGFRHR
jgi:hypothetical protein